MTENDEKVVAPVEQLPMLTPEEYSVLSRLYLHEDLIYLEVSGNLYEIAALMSDYELQKTEAMLKQLGGK